MAPRYVSQCGIIGVSRQEMVDGLHASCQHVLQTACQPGVSVRGPKKLGITRCEIGTIVRVVCNLPAEAL